MRRVGRRFLSTQGLTAAGAEVLLGTLVAGWSVLILIDSRRIGWGWAADGPEAGFFSFWIGLIMLVCAVLVIGRNVLVRPGDDGSGNRVVMAAEHVRLFATLIVPTLALILSMRVVGTFVACGLFMLWFAKTSARTTWLAALAIGGGTAVVLFLIFKVGFSVPLPLGPIERALGY